jgi:hypothetical protein
VPQRGMSQHETVPVQEKLELVCAPHFRGG